MNYSYANGIINAIEDKILDRSKLSKLVSRNPDEFVKNLKQVGYGKEEANNLEELIQSEMQNVRSNLEEIAPEQKHIELFYLSQDALNVKVLWKIRQFHQENISLLNNSGSFQIEELREAILEDSYDKLQPKLRKLLETMKVELEDITDPRVLSAMIDQKIFDYAYTVMGKLAPLSLQTYFDIMADMINLSMFIRTLRLGWTYENFTEMALHHGKISKKKYEEAYREPKEKIPAFFKEYYGEMITKILKQYFETSDITEFEADVNRFLMEEMKQFRYDSLSIGPIIYYYLLKLQEANEIRSLYAKTYVTHF